MNATATGTTSSAKVLWMLLALLPAKGMIEELGVAAAPVPAATVGTTDEKKPVLFAVA